MRATQLALLNFRQFAGEQSIRFAKGTPGNVTLVYAANGAGKTTLLNAFTWALYGSLSSDFERPDRLINDSVWAAAAPGDEVEVAVTLQFDHELCDYAIRRSATAVKGESADQSLGASQVLFRFTDERGESHSQTYGDDAIDQILPKRLKDFFFFNGERIENLVKPTAYAEIEAAIKTILGLEQVERAYARHVPEAIKRLQSDLRKVGDDNTAELLQRIGEWEEREASATEKAVEAKRNGAALQAEIDAVEERLRTLASTQELQLRRDALLAERDASHRRERAARQQMDALITTRGFVAFTAEPERIAEQMGRDLRQKGEIPTPLKRQFVEDLLEQGICICGTVLDPGSQPHSHVEEWRTRAGLEEIDEAWTRLMAQIERFRSDRAELRQTLQSQRSVIAEELASRLRVDEELSEVSSKLSSHGEEDIQTLEAKRTVLVTQFGDARKEEGRHAGDAEAAVLAKQRLETELSRAEVKGAQGAIAQRRLNALKEVQTLLREVLALRTQSVRQELDERIKATYQSITFKDYEPELSETFELGLWHTVAGHRLPVAKSTGENQVLSLSFVGAVASLARDRAEEDAEGSVLVGYAGGIYPIVMDAAFGSLDDNYRRDIARALPKLAPQVIVFVSRAQGEGPVEQELRPYVGEEYVVTYYSSKSDREAENIALHGVEVPYVVPGEHEDRAELREVGRA